LLITTRLVITGSAGALEQAAKRPSVSGVVLGVNKGRNMPKSKPSPDAIEGDELTAAINELTALQQKAINRFGRLALEAGLGDIQITNAKLRSGFGDMVATHKTDKPRTTPLLRCRNKLARLKRKAAHKKNSPIIRTSAKK